MELRTYTSLWNVEKKLYKINDITLPVPVSVKSLGALFGAGIPWIFILKTIHFPFAPPWHLVWFVVPCLAAYLAGKPVREGKTMTALILTQMKHLRQSREYARLAPCTGPHESDVLAAVWVAHGADAPDDYPAAPKVHPLPVPRPPLLMTKRSAA